MSTERVPNPAPGETLVGIEPELLQRVDPGWRHRMSLYTGRALTETSLEAEQLYRSGRLALLGQAVTPGVAAGLDVTLADDGTVRVAPGFGLVATGDDVTVARELVTTLDALQVVDGITGEPVRSLHDLKADESATRGGVFVLVLLPVSGKATGAEINTGAAPIEVTGDLSASCRRDPDQYAFEDWEIVDGAQLALAAWPNPANALALPPADPAATWRNRLAFTIFDAEFASGGTPLPWETLGVALGLIAFDTAWKPLFLDRNAVVRSGGRGRHVQLGHANPGMPGDFVALPIAAAEARLLQLLEENAQIRQQADLTAYRMLPPASILPVAAVDLRNMKKRWFPNNWTLHGAPIHTEEVDTVLRTRMFAAPFDLTAVEEGDILVPLPDDVYDPKVLVHETVDPAFEEERLKAVAARNAVLQRRKYLQLEASALLRAEGDPDLDVDAGLSADEKQGRDAAPYVPAQDGSDAFDTLKDDAANAPHPFVAAEVKGLLDKAAAAPFTIQKGDTTIPLFTADDQNVLRDNGLQAFTDRINARVNKVEDALNLSFLQTHTNIYRYRTNVLKATDAARLVTSPIIANIAERESAVATAQDLNAYLTSISGTPATPASAAPAAPEPPPTSSPTLVRAPLNISSRLLTPLTTVSKTAATVNVSTTRSVANLGGVAVTHVADTTAAELSAKFSSAVLDAAVTGSTAATTVALGAMPSQAGVATAADVTAQLPVAGVPFNLRTLNIAERLKTSPSHEALLYAISARSAFLDAVLAADFGISVDDLEILVQEQDAQDKTKFNLVKYSIGQLRTDAAKRSSAFTSVQMAGLAANADEPAVFSGGITTLDHHTLLLRAVEARIALYRQFLALVDRAQDNVDASLARMNAALKRLDNDLADARGNLSLVLGLLKDEQARVQQVNAQRVAVLKRVPFIVLARRGTLPAEGTVPSQQLFPANVASPVPAALQSTAVIPPELREFASILREAPPAWLPAIEPLLAKLERPQHFTDLALQMRVRAFARVQVPPAPSSAPSHPGPFGAPIADMFNTHQAVVGALMQQRAAFDHTQLAAMSWSAQKDTLFHVAAINDLIASDAVHLEIATAVTAIIDHVSKVATALYLRVSSITPAERLAWAEYLRGDGRHVNVRSLSLLPEWNETDYIERQQMQMLVDWLFTQIDVTIPDAVAYMSDMVRTAILLASHAPVDDVLAGEVAARTKPEIGTRIPLTSVSPRVAHGMPVLLYDGADLAARAVVDDLDAQHVTVKVTNVYKPGVELTESAHAHFLNNEPQNTLTVKAAVRAGR